MTEGYVDMKLFCGLPGFVLVFLTLFHFGPTINRYVYLFSKVFHLERNIQIKPDEDLRNYPRVIS